MFDNQMMLKDRTIRTNYYNNHYKQRIKRAKSKPNIRRGNIINYNNNEDKNEQLINNIIYDENRAQNFINKNNNESQTIYNNNNNIPSELSYSSSNRDNEYSYSYNQRKNNEHESTRRVINSNYQELPIYKKQLNNYNTPKDDWAEMLYHPTENKDLSNKINNSKTFESNIFPIDNAPMDKVRHSKETKYSDRLHKTQITTLPGCIKRGKYDIKDDKYFMNKNNESYLYKVEHDFNSNVNFGPLSKKEENAQIYFPVKQRYQGSYQRGVKDNDIFNLNNEEEKQNDFVPGKKLFKNNNSFKSQIIFV
jgi:hypothetical protein